MVLIDALMRWELPEQFDRGRMPAGVRLCEMPLFLVLVDVQVAYDPEAVLHVRLVHVSYCLFLSSAIPAGFLSFQEEGTWHLTVTCECSFVGFSVFLDGADFGRFSGRGRLSGVVVKLPVFTPCRFYPVLFHAWVYAGDAWRSGNSGPSMGDVLVVFFQGLGELQLGPGDVNACGPYFVER